MKQVQSQESAHRAKNLSERLISRPFPNNPLARCAATGFRAAVLARNNLYDRLPWLSYKAACPVISIGGISAGGTGKTPVTLFVGRYLLSKGWEVAFLSRGYQRKERQTRIVAPNEPVSWEQVGDEPHFLHDRLPKTWLGIDGQRRRTAELLQSRMPARSVFVLDDGFQHRALQRDLDIVCLHHTVLEDRILPAGYLREPLSALGRANAALLIGAREDTVKLDRTCAILAGRFPKLPLMILYQEPETWVNAASGEKAAKPPLDRPVLICGIARPERFINMVRASGIIPGKKLIFSDHHDYLRNDFAKTRELYSKGIITTEKDVAKLCAAGFAAAQRVWYLSIRLCFDGTENEKKFYGLIDKHLPNI